MSRVYEAMRRASLGREDATVAVADNALPSAEEFGAEAYPSEQLVPQSPPLTPAPTTPAPAPVPEPVDRGTTSLMEAGASAPDVPAAALPSRVQTFDRIATRYEGKTVLDGDVSPASREQYRRLAATLHRAQATHGLRVIMVTSAVMGEGKTLTASNVALTLSQSYQKQVLLIDADLRRPAVQAVFGIEAHAGLSESLTADEERPVPVHQISPRLGILTAGRPTSDPIAALTSERMHRLIGEAREAFDWVILDTPPVALLSDANLVSAMTDGAIVVVKAGHTPCDLVERAVKAVGRERTLGVVLNHAATPAHGSGYYADYYYSSGTAK